MTDHLVAHNHPPMCCCRWALDVDSYQPTTICPLCPEHGELAQLSAQEIESLSPGQIRAIARSESTDAAHDAAVAAALAGTRLAGPCPSCHQLPGRPPTDYCQHPENHYPPATSSAPADTVAP